MWYIMAQKLADDHSTFNRSGYLAHGHSYTNQDPDPHREDKAKLPPPNPNDAIWVFRQGKLEVMTAGEWHQQGHRGYTFVHDEIFGPETGGLALNNGIVKGRYDSRRNTISIVKSNDFRMTSSIVLRALDRRFPGAQVVEF